MSKKYQGLIIVKTVNGNWNAGFDGLPKNYFNDDGEMVMFASDKALKYAIRQKLRETNPRIFYSKEMRYDESKKTLVPMTSKEKFEKVTGLVIDKKPDMVKIIPELYKFEDIKYFGALLAVKDSSIGLTGKVQISTAINVDKESVIITDDIIAPFASKSGNDQTTIGKQVFADETHHVYQFYINPELKDSCVPDELQTVLTEEDIERFLEAASTAVTDLNTCSKNGSKNELLLLIESPSGELVNLDHRMVSVIRSTEDSKTKIAIKLPKLPEGATLRIINGYDVEVDIVEE